MRNTKRVVALGAGPEIHAFLKYLHEDVDIVAFGADKSNINAAKEAVEFCRGKNIPVISGYSELDSYKPDFIFMASYPLLIPAAYLAKYKFINMHSALLPAYRGIHGGTWAIINGEKYHGYTIHRVADGIDNGPIYFQQRIKISDKDDVGSIRKTIAKLFEKNIRKVFLKIIEGKIKSKKQDETLATYVCRRYPEDGLIDWNESSKNIFNLIRALKPPYTQYGAFTFYQGERLSICDAELYKSPSYKSVNGQVSAILKSCGVLIKCGDNLLLLKTGIWKGKQIQLDQLFKKVGIRLKSQ